MIRPVRGLAHSGERRLIGAAVDVASSPAAERALDAILAGPMPEMLGRSLAEHRVVERVVAEMAAMTDLEQTAVSAIESEHTARLVEQVLASPAVGKASAELADRVLGSADFDRILGQIVGSPQVRAALAQQSTSLAAEAAAGARRRAERVDASAERGPRRWLRRPPRPAVEQGETPALPYAGLATRGIALAIDAGLVALILLIGSALVSLVASLVGHLRPEWLVGTILGGAGVIVSIIYFVGFWSTAGQTPGMRLLRLRVLHGNEPPGFWRSLARLFGLALAIIPCFAGFLPVLVDDRRRALQDYIAGTAVVYDENPTAPAMS